MIEQSGKTLGLLGNDRWKGGETHNGTLLKLHDNAFTIGYSKLTTPVGAVAKYGFGVWYDKTDKNNTVYTEKPAGTDGAFAGILTRQVHIATGYPAKNDQIDEHNKGLIAKDGFMIYKTGYNEAIADPATDEDQTYADVEVGMLLCINDVDGRFHFASVCPADHHIAGVVIAMNPDDSSWTVRIICGLVGVGVPAGGTTGQVLAKASSADGDVEWITP